MGTTTPDALPYPEQNDEVDVPTDLSELAVAVQAALHRATICTSSTRPSSPTDGLTIWETDTKLLKVYDLVTTSWVGVGSPGTGGGGGGDPASGGGRWYATGAGQSIPATVSGPGTIVAFGQQLGTPTGVTRTTQGAGHKFELESSGVWACAAQTRIQSAAAAGEVSSTIWADLAGGTTFEYNVDADGGRREGVPRQLKPGRSTYLPAGTTLAVFLYNGTGSTRTLEPDGGNWVNLDLWLVG